MKLGKKAVQIIRGVEYELTREEVLRTAERLVPEPIKHWYVEIERKTFPPKQIISEALKLERLDFTTDDAKRFLEKLQFQLGRIP